MLIPYAVAGSGYLILAGAIYFLYYKLTKAKEALFAARRHAVHADANFEAAKQAARLAEKRCVQALQNVQLSLSQADKAMEVAGHIQVVSEQVHYITECLTGPREAMPAGRHHAMDTNPGRPVIAGKPGQGRYTRYVPEEHAS